MDLTTTDIADKLKNPSPTNTLTSNDSISSSYEDIFLHARNGQKKWEQWSFSRRKTCIEKMSQYIHRHSDAIAKTITDCTGKTITDALATEVVTCLLACNWYAKNTQRLLKPQSLKTSSYIFANKKSSIHHIPLGVVGIISPWNYPLAIPFGEVVMGLMAGNAILLKVASNVRPVGKVIEQIIAAAELPSGVFTLLEESGETASKAMFHYNIDKIFFTGSVEVGKKLMKQASNTLTPLSLELGGNDPMIVLEDADLERTTNGAAWGAFQNAGQTCGGIERAYIHESIYDQFVSLLAKKTRHLRHGPSDRVDTDIGKITTKKQFTTISQQVNEAIQSGATIRAQSTIHQTKATDYIYPATLLENVNHHMSIMKEETFGPILCLMKFKTIEEAISLANDATLALTSSIWSKNTKKAKEIALKLESGVTTINDHIYTHALTETPWGGWKESGIGRTHGEAGLKEMTHLKVVNWDTVPLKRNFFWFPFDRKTYLGIKSVLDILSTKDPVTSLKHWLRLASLTLKKMLTPWTPSN